MDVRQTRRLRAAVVGVGYLGRYHSQKYAALADTELVAVVDIDPLRAQRIGAEFAVPALTDHRALAGKVDIASVAVPAQSHYPVARDLLNAGIHVLIEKPIATDVRHARRLVELAAERGRTLQVGHLERFNPVLPLLNSHLDGPRFIEASRISPFQQRGTDVSVIMDLMIHDLDLVLHLVAQPITEIRASGVAVLSREIDIANARIQFADGCVANLTASRVSFKNERRMRLFQRDSYLSVDFDNSELDVRRVLRGIAMDEPAIESRCLRATKRDALLAEISAFVQSILQGSPPLVGGYEGVRALEAAVEILQQLDGAPQQPDAPARTRYTDSFAIGRPTP